MPQAETKIRTETYVPLPQQANFHACGARNKFFGGSMGSGKTRTLCEQIHSLMFRYPKNRGLLLRKVLNDFKLTTYLILTEKTLAHLIELGKIKENKQEHYFQYWNGSRLYYGGLESKAPDAIQERKKYFSGEYGVIALDEAREFTEKEFTDLGTRLRHSLTPTGKKKFPPFYMILASNPSQNWLKTRFILNPTKDYQFFPALPKDNTHNPPEYEAQLRELFKNDEKALKAYVEGSWDAVGSIDDLFLMTDIQVVVDYDIPFRPIAKRITVCDPARFGDDTTQIYDFQDTKIIGEESYGKKSTMETVGRLLYHKEKNRSSMIVVDPIGEGAGIVDRLSEIEREVSQKFQTFPVDFRTVSSDPDRYYNLRAEVYWNAKKIIDERQCSIPNDPQLHGQLCGIKYTYVGGGKYGTKIQIESKEKIKERLGVSPDKADAFVMGLYALRFAKENPLHILTRDELIWRRGKEQVLNRGKYSEGVLGSEG